MLDQNIHLNQNPIQTINSTSSFVPSSEKILSLKKKEINKSEKKLSNTTEIISNFSNFKNLKKSDNFESYNQMNSSDSKKEKNIQINIISVENDTNEFDIHYKKNTGSSLKENQPKDINKNLLTCKNNYNKNYFDSLLTYSEQSDKDEIETIKNKSFNHNSKDYNKNNLNTKKNYFNLGSSLIKKKANQNVLKKIQIVMKP